MICAAAYPSNSDLKGGQPSVISRNAGIIRVINEPSFPDTVQARRWFAVVSPSPGLESQSGRCRARRKRIARRRLP